MITLKQARLIGVKQTLKFTLLMWVILEFLWMINETSGDFANGILFFIHYHSYYQILVFYIVVFSIFSILGRSVGYDVIVGRKNAYATALKYIVLTWVIMILAIFILDYLDVSIFNWETINKMPSFYLAIALPSILIWILSIRSIQSIRRDS